MVEGRESSPEDGEIVVDFPERPSLKAEQVRSDMVALRSLVGLSTKNHTKWTATENFTKCLPIVHKF
jgi:hypothetical protein